MADSGLILVVDDTPANLEVMNDILSDAGYEVASAIDGERALRRIQAHPPDLILLDIQMPGIDGFETCQRLKSNPSTANIPVIFMTALSDTDSKVKGFNLGGVDYITKPFQAQEMLARVSTHLQLYQLTRHLEQRVEERTQELQMALEELNKSQLQLIQNEKMSALGNLVAGVAHEVNNPVGFIAGNLEPAQAYIKDLLHLIDLYQAELPHPSDSLQELIEDIDLGYLRDDLPKLISSMREGVNRIRQISTSLRTFSRADSDRPTRFNLHEGIDSTLMILKHRLKAQDNRPEIEVRRNYGDLPQVECYAGQLNQVFMNLLANAIDALEEAWRKDQRPLEIEIETRLSDREHVRIQIADQGLGMAEEVKQHIFDHLFTTKGVGYGTGLGLTIARQIIVEKHQGTIAVNSVLGCGSQFIIEIPINAAS